MSDTTLAIELPGSDDLGVRRTTASRRLDAALSDDEDSWPPQVTALVVGAGRDPGLDRLIEFLATDHGIDIEAVTFEVFGLADGEMIMIREIAETTPGPEPVPEDDRLKAVLAQAQKTAIERSPKTSWRRERASAFMPAHTKPA